MRFGRYSLVAVTVLLALGSVPSQASLVFSVQQVGADVIVTGNGTAITTGLTTLFTASTNAVIAPAADALTVGPTSNPLATDYTGVTGPSNFGSGGITFASSGTGQRFGLNSFGPQLLLEVPSTYISGTALGGTSTYSNATLASLGVTPGTYVYSFGSGVNADTLTIRVISAAVPEPGSVALLAGMGTMGVGFLRRRKQASKAA